jgi:ABC-type lipoprotein export system ATPase subunit
VSLVVLRDVFVVHPSEDGGVAALRGMTLAVEEGEICVVLGPSGAGKSTLVRVVAGLQRPSAGLAVVDGLDLGAARSSAVARHRSRVVGYADQHYWRALSADLTAEELVALPLGLRGVPRAERVHRADELLERVGLLDRASSRPGELSGGEQQRIALCAALAHRPTLLVADEPTGELDEATAHGVLDLLRELARDAGAAALVVSHDPESAEIADRVVHVRDGRVSEEGGALVIDDRGWLRLPGQLRERLGVTAVADEAPAGVLLRPAAELPEPLPDLFAPAAAPVPGPVVASLADVRHDHVPQIVSLDLAGGALTVLCGRSGSGKTTLLRTLAGLERAAAGTVAVEGHTVNGDRASRALLRRPYVAFAMQGGGLAEALDAEANVALGRTLRGLEPAPDRAAELFAALHLQPVLGRPVRDLSGGERQRVAIARALGADVPLVLLDEPTSQLDEANAERVAALLVAEAAGGTAVVCATHDPVLIAAAERVVEIAR